MKRNWDKLREVLEAVEEDRFKVTLNDIYGDQERVDFIGHLLLCIDARLVLGVEVVTNRKDGCHLRFDEEHVRLTMEGHDILESLRKTEPPRPERHVDVGGSWNPQR